MLEWLRKKLVVLRVAIVVAGKVTMTMVVIVTEIKVDGSTMDPGCLMK